MEHTLLNDKKKSKRPFQSTFVYQEEKISEVSYNAREFWEYSNHQLDLGRLSWLAWACSNHQLDLGRLSWLAWACSNHYLDIIQGMVLVQFVVNIHI